jgi:hypothetical protein
MYIALPKAENQDNQLLTPICSADVIALPRQHLSPPKSSAETRLRLTACLLIDLFQNEAIISADAGSKVRVKLKLKFRGIRPARPPINSAEGRWRWVEISLHGTLSDHHQRHTRSDSQQSPLPQITTATHTYRSFSGSFFTNNAHHTFDHLTARSTSPTCTPSLLCL